MIDKTTIRVIGLIIFCGYAMAWADDEPTSEDIEPQPLNEALREFADRSGLQVVYRTELAAGIETEGTDAPADEREALDQLLGSTGLAYRFINDRTISIQAVDVEVARDRGNAATTPVAMLIAQASENQATTNRTSSESEDKNGIVRGEVTDARTGANLKGALVTIEETGQRTSTNDLGEFRLVNVPTGSVTLTVSYLGYAGQSAVVRVRGTTTSKNFALRGGTQIEEIIVFGQRSARAQALNQERTASNSRAVLSADALGSFNGTTVSEAMRRAPGIAFVPDSETGDGAQVIVRGLEPDLNQVTLNGVRLLDGTGLGRSPDLSSILTESIESVTINKTLLPSQDSNGAGALIEIEAKAPLDREERFARFGLEYGETGGNFVDEFGVNGTVSGIFGENKTFGTSLSVSYRERNVTRLDYSLGSNGTDVSFEVLPATNREGGAVTSIRDISPLRNFPFESNFDNIYPRTIDSQQGSTDQETLSLVSSLQKKFNTHTDIRLDVVYTENNRSTYTDSLFVSADKLNDAAPVDALGGEVRLVLVNEDIARNSPDPLFPIFFGDGIPGSIVRSSVLRPDDETATLSISFRGDTRFDEWSLEYGFGYNSTESDSAAIYGVRLGEQALGLTGFFDAIADRSILSEKAINNTTDDGRIISIFAPLETGAEGQFALPLFNQAGFDFYNDVDNLPVGIRVLGPRQSEGDEIDLHFNARRNFQGGLFDYVEIGSEYNEADFLSPARLGTTTTRGFGDFEPAEGVFATDLGLRFGPGILTAVGASGDFAALNRQSVERFVNNIPLLVDEELLVTSREFVDRGDEFFSGTSETTLTGYFEIAATFGKLEVIGGARFEDIDVESTSFSTPQVYDVNGNLVLDPDEFGSLLTEAASQTEIMPRLLANYRLSDDMLIRGGYFVTVSRPQLSNLTDRRRVTLFQDPQASSTGDRPLLSVTAGNPDLKPAKTHSFSLDWEFYDGEIGVLKVATFYKVIENPLQTNRVLGGQELLPEDLVLPDISFFNDLPSAIEVQVQRPVNGDEDNEIWGVELTAERRLVFLPGAWSGLGIYANYTYIDSSSTQRLSVNTSVDPRGFVEFEDVPFEGSPEHQGTAGLTYSRAGIDASLLYTAQARRLSSISSFGLDNYNEAVDTLDLQVRYLFDVGGRDVTVFLRGEDLLSDEYSPFLQTSIGGENRVPEYYTGGTYFGGRSIFGGVSVVF